MQRAFVYINAILFSSAILAGGIFNAWSHNVSGLLERESRKIVEWPAFDWEQVRSGRWTRQFEDAFADHFMFRAAALEISSHVNAWRGLPAPDVQIVTGKSGDVFNEQAISRADAGPGAAASSREKDSSAKADSPAGKTADEAKGAEVKAPAAGLWVNQMLIIGSTAFGLVGYSDEGGSYYAKAVNTLASKLDPSVRVYDILVPTAIEFLGEERYTKMSYPQEKGIGLIYAKFDPRVKGINVVPALREHRDEYIYFRTDHHWTARGAYYAYRAAGAVMGYQAPPLSSYPREDVPGFVGSLVYQTQSPILQANPDTAEIFYPTVEHTMTRYYSGGVLGGKAIDKSYMLGSNRYTAFIAGDVPRSVIKAAVPNGRKILILKDSYGNAFIPFLIPHFQEIHIIDPRYWNGSLPVYAREQGITDVLVFNCFQIISYYGGFSMNLLRVSP